MTAALTQGGTRFDRARPDRSSVVIKVTVDGDAKLDKTIDFDDLQGLARDYNQSGSTEPIPGATAAFETDVAAVFATAVPGPQGSGLLDLAAASLLAQRRGPTPGRRRRTFAK